MIIIYWNKIFICVATFLLPLFFPPSSLSLSLNIHLIFWTAVACNWNCGKQNHGQGYYTVIMAESRLCPCILYILSFPRLTAFNHLFTWNCCIPQNMKLVLLPHIVLLTHFSIWNVSSPPLSLTFFTTDSFIKRTLPQAFHRSWLD